MARRTSHWSLRRSTSAAARSARRLALSRSAWRTAKSWAAGPGDGGHAAGRREGRGQGRSERKGGDGERDRKGGGERHNSGTTDGADRLPPCTGKSRLHISGLRNARQWQLAQRDTSETPAATCLRLSAAHATAATCCRQGWGGAGNQREAQRPKESSAGERIRAKRW